MTQTISIINSLSIKISDYVREAIHNCPEKVKDPDVTFTRYSVGRYQHLLYRNGNMLVLRVLENEEPVYEFILSDNRVVRKNLNSHATTINKLDAYIEDVLDEFDVK